MPEARERAYLGEAGKKKKKKKKNVRRINERMDTPDFCTGYSTIKQ